MPKNDEATVKEFPSQRTAPEAESQKTRKNFLNRNKGWLAKSGVLAVLPSVALIASLNSGGDKLPEPKPTGEIVTVVPKDGEGVNQLMSDLDRNGYATDRLAKAVAQETNEQGGLTGDPIHVDSGYITSNPNTLVQYGVPREDQPK